MPSAVPAPLTHALQHPALARFAASASPLSSCAVARLPTRPRNPTSRFRVEERILALTAAFQYFPARSSIVVFLALTNTSKPVRASISSPRTQLHGIQPGIK
ncbi:hypothetical protein B0H15DRAFT_1028103, partial [Mycena belliarum]